MEARRVVRYTVWDRHEVVSRIKRSMLICSCLNITSMCGCFCVNSLLLRLIASGERQQALPVDVPVALILLLAKFGVDPLM